MASRVTNEDIIRINMSYYKNKTYAAAARETGFSAGTVKKYIIPNWEPAEPTEMVKFALDEIPDFSTECFLNVDNFGELCVLSSEEKEEIEKLWKELAI